MAVHASLYCVVLLSPSFSFCFCSFKSLGLEVEKEKDTEGGKTGRICMNCLKELLLVTQRMVPRNLECLAKLSKICKILSALRNRSSNTRKRNSKKSVISSFPAVRGRKPFCKNCLLKLQYYVYTYMLVRDLIFLIFLLLSTVSVIPILNPIRFFFLQ